MQWHISLIDYHSRCILHIATYTHQNTWNTSTSLIWDSNKWSHYWVSLATHKLIWIFTLVYTSWRFSSLALVHIVLAGTWRTERLVLITAYQQILSCTQGQHPLNQIDILQGDHLCFIYPPMQNTWSTLLQSIKQHFTHIVWAQYQHKQAASISFVFTSRLPSLWRAMCLPNTPSLDV